MAYCAESNTGISIHKYRYTTIMCPHTMHMLNAMLSFETNGTVGQNVITD